jgi:hypothetical protein
VITFLAAISWIKERGGHTGQLGLGAQGQILELGSKTTPQGGHLTSLMHGQFSIG